MKTQNIRIHGHEVHCIVGGKGPALVLIHGMASSAAAWNRVVPALARRFTVVVPDLLGHGASAKPRAEYSVSGHANVLRDLLAALGHERATLVGQSFGGGVAMQLAYQYPEHCERLALVSSGGLGREVGTLLRLLSLPGAEHVFPLFCSPALRDASQRAVAWLGGLGLNPSPAVEEALRSYSALTQSDARRAFFRTLQSVIDPGGQSVSAGNRLYLASAVPTLIVWGREDAIIPVDHAVTAHEAIPGSRLEVFEGVGHFPHCEAPDRFVDVLVDFIDTTEPACVTPDVRRELLRRQSVPGALVPAAGV